jgi:hypothetical protein
VFAPAAIVTGHIARGQIRRTGEAGGGLALAGLIIGYVYVGFLVVFIAILIPFSIFVDKDIRQSIAQAHVRNAALSARPLFITHGGFPAGQTQFLAELRRTERYIDFVSGTTVPTQGADVVSAYVLPTRNVAIFTAVDGNGACWVEAVNGSGGSVDTIPAGTSFYGRKNDAGRSCRAQTFASSGSATWRASFNTFPGVT